LKTQGNSIGNNIYIVIVNWNGIDDTIECVESLQVGTFKSFKVIIVDNGSMDNQAARLSSRFPQARLIINQENLGFARGANIGIEYAISREDCDYILVLNNDTIVPPEALAVLHDTILNLPNTLLSPAVLFIGTNRIQSIGGRINRILGYCRNIGKNRLYKSDREDSTADFLYGCAIIGHKSIWERLGGFDEDYFAYFEDVDLSLRARLNNYKLRVTHRTFIYHRQSSSLAGQPEIKTYLLTRNAIIFARKRLTFKWIFIFNSLPYHLLLGLVRQRSLKAFPSWLRGVKDGLTHTLGKDQSKQTKRQTVKAC
jgi:GT2 family glycosyltransferase